MSSGPFSATRQRVDALVADDVEVSVVQSPRSTRGDVGVVAMLEGVDDGSGERFETEQTTVQVVNDAGEVYAEAIIQVLPAEEPVAMIDWVEVVDVECRGQGVGRALHEDVVQFIESQLGVARVYTKLENPSMQGPVLDTGFQQVDAPSTSAWYRRG